MISLEAGNFLSARLCHNRIQRMEIIFIQSVAKLFTLTSAFALASEGMGIGGKTGEDQIRKIMINTIRQAPQRCEPFCIADN